MSPQPNDSYFNLPMASSSQKLPSVRSVLNNNRFHPYQQSQLVNNAVQNAPQASQNPQFQNAAHGNNDLNRAAVGNKKRTSLDKDFDNLCKRTFGADFDDTDLNVAPRTNAIQNKENYKLPNISAADAEAVLAPNKNQYGGPHANVASQMLLPPQNAVARQNVGTVSQVRRQQAPLQSLCKQPVLPPLTNVQVRPNVTQFKHPAPVTRQNHVQQALVPKQSPSLYQRNQLTNRNLVNKPFLRQPISNVATYHVSTPSFVQNQQNVPPKIVQAPTQVQHHHVRQPQVNVPMISAAGLPHNHMVGGQFVNHPQQQLQQLVPHNQFQVMPQPNMRGMYGINRPQQQFNFQSQVAAMPSKYNITDDQLVQSGNNKRFNGNYRLVSRLGKGGQGSVYLGLFLNSTKTNKSLNLIFIS